MSLNTTIAGLHVEGNLIAGDFAADLVAGNIKGQSAEDFGFTKADKLADEIAIIWGEAKKFWSTFKRSREESDFSESGTSETRKYWAVPLLYNLGYLPSYRAEAEVVDGQTFAISHRAGFSQEHETPSPPIHITGCNIRLDQKPPSGNPRLSAHALMQEYLNRTEHLWGIVTNGLQWRLLRDSSLMTRLTYIEFDLEQILEGEDFAEFGLFYRLFHRSRLPQGIDDTDSCLLEFYHQETLQQGGRVRDRLRDGVEKAIAQFGNGFLQHPRNQALRDKFAAKEIGDRDFYRQLLLLIYRLLFLMVAESRNLLLTGEDLEKVRIYQEYYSIDRLRALTERPMSCREGFQDLWQGLRVTFCLFDENWRGELLGLSPLNGDLFGSTTLTELNESALDNYDLMIALRNLSLYAPTDRAQLRRVNYAALDVEELGSVYESLLDFHPQVSQSQGKYEFLLVSGSDRKTTGAYYTPSELVVQLVKSALEPVIEERLNAVKNSLTPQQLQEAALLSIKVCDPACGSGHFLLAAARRIGRELARVRTGEPVPSPEPLRQAIRDAIQHCIYGVDVNPLAVDLCKVALWIEGFAKGMPLNFLDHRIKCGNSLVGVLNMNVLKEGIPDEAFKAVTGDDKALSSQLKKSNKKSRQTDLKGQLSTVGQLDADLSNIAQAWQQLDRIPETTAADVKLKKAQYEANLGDTKWWKSRSACNLWTAAFFMPLTEQNLQLLPTTAALVRLLNEEIPSPSSSPSQKGREGTGIGEDLAPLSPLGRGTGGEGLPTIGIRDIVDAANQLATEKRFFHWALEFPDVFENDGFDCILGNPPWERIKLQEKEFFASRDLEIAKAANKSEREKLIKTLPKRKPELAREFEAAKHDAEAQSKFIRESNRFPLTAVGDVNTYAVFSETARDLIAANGRAGIIIPSGIATDDTCKRFFEDLMLKENLESSIGFRNLKLIFSDVHDSVKFSLFIMGGAALRFTSTKLVWLAVTVAEANNPKKVVSLSYSDLATINPNTLTCPIFRTATDAVLTKKIYQHVPVLENEKTGRNPWGISFMTMFHMSNDSGLFKNAPNENTVPLYEAKMFWYYDHRFGDYADYPEGAQTSHLPDVPVKRLQNPNYKISPRYWIEHNEIENRLVKKWDRKWLIAFRDITNTSNERTTIFSLMPKGAFGNTCPICLVSQIYLSKIACLVANFSSLIFDFISRQKVGGTHLTFFYLKQLPVLPPDRYTQTDIEFIAPRVLELTYTAWDIKPFADDLWNPSLSAPSTRGVEAEGKSILTQVSDKPLQLGLDLDITDKQQLEISAPPDAINLTRLRELILARWQDSLTTQPLFPNSEGEQEGIPIPPFIWNEERRAQIRAELDAYYAKLYGLTRDELRYILDPADVYGADFPSETFRVLKNNEMKKYGEYRTQRLVLEAWDKLGY
jgi:hypothetical protein